MSLRDDLEYLIAQAAPFHPASGFQGAVDRLRAALTPAAEKWLEALPELLEIENRITRGPWWFVIETNVEEVWKICDGAYKKDEFYNDWIMRNDTYYPSVPHNQDDWFAIVALRNAIHEAAALHNAQDNKEQK